MAFYTQATFELNDQFAIVAGIRYAKDDKEALERRVAYAEIALASAFSPILVGLSTIPSAAYPTNMAVSAEGFQIPGVGQNTLAFYATPAAAGGFGCYLILALTNIAAGRAVFNGNPANPITPVCASLMPVARRPYCSKAFLTASRGERLIRILGRTRTSASI